MEQLPLSVTYAKLIFTALYSGYSNGIAIVSFKYDNEDREQLQSIFKNSILFLIIMSIMANIFIHLSLRQALTIFIAGAILILPNILGESGIWIAVSVAKIFVIIIAILFLIIKRDRYSYA